MSALLAALGFITLIVLHELGHFTAAKAVGMRVERFSLFFPPLLVRKKLGETEYAVGALPLGGYVKISGMNPDEDLPDEVRTRAYHAQPVWKRIVVIAAGPVVNLIIALLLFVAFFWLIGPQSQIGVADVDPDLPAAGVLQEGDRLIAVDGQRGDLNQLSEAIAEHECPEQPPTEGCEATTPANLTVLRDGERMQLELTPVYDAEEERTRVGFQFGVVGPRDPLPLGAAVAESLDRFWLVTRETVKLPVYLADPELREQITGLVGNYEISRQVIADDIENAVSLFAVISLALAIINLFPFLPLDGGHIFWGIVEKVRRKPVSYATMERAGVIGFMLLVPLIVFTVVQDVGNLLGDGFDVP